MKWTSCSDNACGFWAKSRSAKELRYIIKRHAKRYHKVVLTDTQLKDIVKKEGVK
jgi:predicted small metal-binding protein